MFSFIHIVAEDRIHRAVEDGVFDDLEGTGRPLPADEAANMPPELRMAYRVLKNAGYVSEEVRAKAVEQNQIVSTPELFGECSDEQKAYRKMRKLRTSMARANRTMVIDESSPYYESIVNRMNVKE